MSVINRLEVANYLNLDNIAPSHSGWRPDYIHLVLNFRGQSTAVVGTNGVGKSTLNRAMYAILSRDQRFTTDTRAVAAPKRSGAYSHIRLEVLYRDQPVGGLLGNMGADVPGEPYVLGMYCNSDSEIVFYAYQGHLEDCPVATQTGTRIRIVADQDFRATLREMPRLLHNPAREEWLAFVAKHFDPALLGQLVAYQKAGGGDSVEDFFKVRLRRSDGQTNAYDSAFFFEFVAPEVLANAMRGFAKEGETRFEDTILQSATPLTRAELKFEQSAAALKRDQETFREIEKVHMDLDTFLEARTRVDRNVEELAGEVGFILDITEKNPLPGVPCQLHEMSTKTNLVANRLVVADGQWTVPDNLLAELWEAEPGEVNQAAERAGIIGVRTRQVVEIYCYSFSGRSTRGPAGRVYSLDQALAMTDKRTKFAESWAPADVERALRDGFRYRIEKGEANHLRPKLASLGVRLAEAQKEEHEAAEQCDNTRRQLQNLTNRIESLKAEEYELTQIRRSGLFSGEEIADLGALQSTTEDALRSAREEREGHQQRHAALKAEREAHEAFRAQWPDYDHPQTVLEGLEAAVREASEAASKAGTVAKDAEEAASAAEAAREEAEQELEARHEQHAKVQLLMEPVERFEELFPGEDPKGLEEQVTAAHNRAIKEHADLRSASDQLHKEHDGLRALEPAWRVFRSIFPKDDPEGLEATITEDLTTARAHRDDLEKTRIPHVRRELAELEQGAKACHAVLEGVNDAEFLNSEFKSPEIGGLERRLRARHALLREDLGGLAKTLEQARKDRAAHDDFAARFGTEHPQDARERRRGEHAVATTERDKLRTQKADIERQLRELSRAATAAGRVANEVIETIGGTPLRVHQIIDETLDADDPRRELVVTHFSHVLHAPVAQTVDEARAMLEALEKAGIESAVFWKPNLVAFCQEAEIRADDDGMAVSIMAGLKTLQVEGLLDPHKIEQTRQRRTAELARISAALDELKTKLADLDEASRTSAIVREACAAVKRGLIDRLSGLEGKVRSIEVELAQIDKLLEDDSVAAMRTAETFVDQGGDDALARTNGDLVKLQEELAELKRRVAHLQRQIDAVPTIRKALRFQLDGGEERQMEIGHELAATEERIDAIEGNLACLRSRLDAIPEIRAALRFQEMGGREGLARLISEIASLEEARNESRQTANDTRRAAQIGSKVHRNAENHMNKQQLALAERRPVLATAAAYLESGGLEFDRAYKEVLSSLKDYEKRCEKRASFRFGLALQAFEAESAGESSATLQAERTTLQRQVNDHMDRIQELRDEAKRLMVQVSDLRPLVERIDHVAAELTARRRQARQAVADAELTAERIARAPQSEELRTAMSFASHLREEVALQERNDREIVDALEDLEGDTRALSLRSRLPSIKEARDRKDDSWKTYLKSVETLRRNKEIALAESDRALLEEALAEPGTARVTEILKTFERHLASSKKKHEDVQQDLEAQKQQLSESLKAFTLTVGENFKLLKSCLRPANPGDAGFEIKASVVDRASIREAVDKIISMIKSEERQRTERVGQGTALESQREYDERVRKAIRDIFYRSIFTGAGSSESERRAPRIFLRHPRIGGGQRMRLTRNISTGQRQGLGLLFMTKMADFAISRDEHFDLSAIRRSRAPGHHARMVMIDGLFSNLSNRRLIRESLDALRDLKGKFQLIGWVHNESYENDPEIFPEYIALRRIGDTEGFVVADDGAGDDGNESDTEGKRLTPGNIAAVEMHVDPLPGVPVA